MISQLIDYLLHQPSDSASPMAVALNVPDLLSELGGADGPVAMVNLIDTRDTEMNPPYCRFYDKGDRLPDGMFLGGSYQEKQIMVVECAAYGPTESIASERADYLKRAIRGRIQLLIGTFHSGVPAPSVDLAGSAATDNISSVNIIPGLDEPTISGPGSDLEKPEWTCIRRLQVGVRVFFGRP